MTGRPAVLQAVFPNNVALGPLPSGTCVGRQGDIDDTAVEAAGVMIAQRMVNQRLAPSSIEARGVVAHYEPGRETLNIWLSTRNPHILHTFLAQTLGLGQDRVRGIAPEVGGGFGAKINIYGERVRRHLRQPLAGGRRGGRARCGHEGQGQDGEVAKFAAALLEAHDSDLMFENGTTAVKGAPASAKAFGEVAAHAYRPVKLPRA